LITGCLFVGLFKKNIDIKLYKEFILQKSEIESTSADT